MPGLSLYVNTKAEANWPMHRVSEVTKKTRRGGFAYRVDTRSHFRAMLEAVDFNQEKAADFLGPRPVSDEPEELGARTGDLRSISAQTRLIADLEREKQQLQVQNSNLLRATKTLATHNQELLKQYNDLYFRDDYERKDGAKRQVIFRDQIGTTQGTTLSPFDLQQHMELEEISDDEKLTITRTVLGDAKIGTTVEECHQHPYNGKKDPRLRLAPLTSSPARSRPEPEAETSISDCDEVEAREEVEVRSIKEELRSSEVKGIPTSSSSSEDSFAKGIRGEPTKSGVARGRIVRRMEDGSYRRISRGRGKAIKTPPCKDVSCHDDSLCFSGLRLDETKISEGNLSEAMDGVAEFPEVEEAKTEARTEEVLASMDTGGGDGLYVPPDLEKLLDDTPEPKRASTPMSDSTSSMPPLLESSASGPTSSDSGHSSRSEGSIEGDKIPEEAVIATEPVKTKKNEFENLLLNLILTKLSCESSRMKAKTEDFTMSTSQVSQSLEKEMMKTLFYIYSPIYQPSPPPITNTYSGPREVNVLC